MDLPATFPEIITHGVEKFGDDVALITSSRRVTYAQLSNKVEHLARALRGAGIAPGDRVGVALPNDWSFVVSVFGAVMCGAIVVPLDVAIRPRNFLHVVNDCEVKALIADARALERLVPVMKSRDDHPDIGFVVGETSSFSKADWRSFEEVFTKGRVGSRATLPPADPTAVVSVSYTSGSTGAPKGVMHSHQSWITGARFTAEYFRISPGHKIAVPLPLHHAYSFRHVIAYLMRGASIVITEDVLSALRLIKKERPDVLLLVPAACNIILKHFKGLIEECGEFLDLVSIGTAPVAEQHLRELQALLPRTEICLPYGLTEARVGFLRPDDEASSRRIFAVQPGLELQVLDNNRNRLRSGEVGEIVLRGKGLMVGYWPGNELEKQRLQQSGFATKDLGRVEKNGEIALLGRGDDIIDIGGRKVAPMEIEEVLLQHPSVLEAAVVGIENPNGLIERQISATVVKERGHPISEQELIDYCKANLEPYKVPASIVFAPSLRRASIGKIVREEAADGYTE